GRLSGARADLEARRGEHGRRAARLAQERERLSARRALCLRDLGRLPPVLAATEGAAPADLDDLVVLGQRLLDAAKRERAALDAVRAEAARLAAARAELQGRLRDEVDEP